MDDHNINANQLQIACNLSNNAITKWKKGISKPSTDALIAIATYFNVSIDFLLNRTEFPQIILSKHPDINYSHLFIENAYLALSHLAHIADTLNIAKKTAIEDVGIKKIEKDLEDSLHYIYDILTVACKGHRITIHKEVQKILKLGYKGFEEVTQDLGITQENLNKLYKEI